TLAAMALGTAIIYVPGLIWLGTAIGWDKPVLELGLWPFLPGDALKVALAAFVLPSIWRLSRRR
ncbi:MAG: biotin transporter BioY, partial [Boseongicola sp.]|nr:biotin transporter BioY [Boseongicola sp.]